MRGERREERDVQQGEETGVEECTVSTVVAGNGSSERRASVGRYQLHHVSLTSVASHASKTVSALSLTMKASRSTKATCRHTGGTAQESERAKGMRSRRGMR